MKNDHGIRNWRDGRVLTIALLFATTCLLPAVGAAQRNPLPSCRALWEEASTEAAKAALDRAKVEAGAASDAAASAWADAWTNAWKQSWSNGANTIRPIGQDCCPVNWFELASLTGKAAWSVAWKGAPQLTGAAQAWSSKFALAYVNEWAKVWYVYFPWLCAKAKVDAAVKVSATASASAKAGASAWAFAIAQAGFFTTSWDDSFASAWGEAQASAWAEAGATATASASADAVASAAAAVSGNCAIARANACAQAMEEAFASAWAAAGAAAFADAYAEAWAEAYASAFANAWAQANAKAAGSAKAQAASKAFAQAMADGYVKAWRVKLAGQGQIPQIVAWWTTPGAPKPRLREIAQDLARAQNSVKKQIAKQALKKAIAGKLKWAVDWDQAAAKATADASAAASAWVSAWAQSWATAWAEAWVSTYTAVCRRAAAAVCAECPCTTTTGSLRPDHPTTTTRERGRTYDYIPGGVTQELKVARSKHEEKIRRQQQERRTTRPGQTTNATVGIVVPAQASGPVSGTITTEPQQYVQIPGLRVLEVQIALTVGADGKPSLANLMVDTGDGALQPADGPITFARQQKTITLVPSDNPADRVTRLLNIEPRAPMPVSKDITTSPACFQNGVGVVHGPGRFSGDTNKMLMALGEEPITPIAANRDAVFFQCPGNSVAGPTHLTVVDGPLAASSPVAVLNLITGVDQSNLHKNQRTNGHVGLRVEGLPAEAWTSSTGPDLDLVDVSEMQKMVPGFQPPQAGQPGFIFLAIQNKSQDKIAIEGFKGPTKTFALKKNSLQFNETLRIRAVADGNFDIGIIAQPFLGAVGMQEFSPNQ